MIKLIKRLRLFVAIVWREWEAGTSIPDKYRVKYRLTIAESWEIARKVHD